MTQFWYRSNFATLVRGHQSSSSQSCVEGEFYTSTVVALQVVGGNKKGSLESETVKYGRESHGSRTRE
jgi:hypothetical protein